MSLTTRTGLVIYTKFSWSLGLHLHGSSIKLIVFRVTFCLTFFSFFFSFFSFNILLKSLSMLVYIQSSSLLLNPLWYSIALKKTQFIHLFLLMEILGLISIFHSCKQYFRAHSCAYLLYRWKNFSRICNKSIIALSKNMHVLNYPRKTETSILNGFTNKLFNKTCTGVFLPQHPINTWYCEIHFYFANHLGMKRISFFKICISLQKCKMAESLFICLLAIVFPCLVIPVYILCTYSFPAMKFCCDSPNWLRHIVNPPFDQTWRYSPVMTFNICKILIFTLKACAHVLYICIYIYFIVYKYMLYV